MPRFKLSKEEIDDDIMSPLDRGVDEELKALYAAAFARGGHRAALNFLVACLSFGSWHMFKDYSLQAAKTMVRSVGQALGDQRED